MTPTLAKMRALARPFHRPGPRKEPGPRGPSGGIDRHRRGRDRATHLLITGNVGTFRRSHEMDPADFAESSCYAGTPRNRAREGATMQRTSTLIEVGRRSEADPGGILADAGTTRGSRGTAASESAAPPSISMRSSDSRSATIEWRSRGMIGSHVGPAAPRGSG